MYFLLDSFSPQSQKPPLYETLLIWDPQWLKRSRLWEWLPNLRASWSRKAASDHTIPRRRGRRLRAAISLPALRTSDGAFALLWGWAAVPGQEKGQGGHSCKQEDSESPHPRRLWPVPTERQLGVSNLIPPIWQLDQKNLRAERGWPGFCSKHTWCFQFKENNL